MLPTTGLHWVVVSVSLSIFTRSSAEDCTVRSSFTPAENPTYTLVYDLSGQVISSFSVTMTSLTDLFNSEDPVLPDLVFDRASELDVGEVSSQRGLGRCSTQISGVRPRRSCSKPAGSSQSVSSMLTMPLAEHADGSRACRWFETVHRLRTLQNVERQHIHS
jgi:hypothetical protein